MIHLLDHALRSTASLDLALCRGPSLRLPQEQRKGSDTVGNLPLYMGDEGLWGSALVVSQWSFHTRPSHMLQSMQPPVPHCRYSRGRCVVGTWTKELPGTTSGGQGHGGGVDSPIGVSQDGGSSKMVGVRLGVP